MAQPKSHTWGAADVGREQPVGGLPRVQAHQVELAEVGHVKHGGSASAGQALLLDLKGSGETGTTAAQRRASPPPRALGL